MKSAKDWISGMKILSYIRQQPKRPYAKHYQKSQQSTDRFTEMAVPSVLDCT